MSARATVSRVSSCREINRVLGTQGFKDRIAALGGEALPLTPADFGAKAVEDSKRFGAIIKGPQNPGGLKRPVLSARSFPTQRVQFGDCD